MRIKKLTLRDFRNIRDCEFIPDPKLNFLIGPNGQGKTSFLEALGFLATLRSFRGSKSAEVLRWGADIGEIVCEVSDGENQSWQTELRILFGLADPLRRKVTKTAHINGKAYRSSTQYLSQRFGSYELGVHAVIFNPADHDLVRGEPSIRRNYLDRTLAACDVEYLKLIQKYQRVLEQRNAVLNSGDRASRDLWMGFTEPLVSLSSQLVLKRLHWIQALATKLDDTGRQIAPHQPKLELIYLSNWVPPIDGLSLINNNLDVVHFAGHGALPSLELLEQAFWKRVTSVESAEWKAGHTLVGAHRDDWAFFLGGQPLKGHGSQGEVRSALLALKICELSLFRNATGHKPLFLLDDFSSELDRDRRKFLLKFLSESDLQVFVTSTEETAFPELPELTDEKRFRVSNGKLTRD